MELLFAYIPAEFFEEVDHIGRTLINHPFYNITQVIKSVEVVKITLLRSICLYKDNRCL